MFTETLLERRRFLASLGALAAAPAFGKGPAPYAAVKAMADRYVAEKKLAGLSFALSQGDAPVSYVNAGTLAFDSAAAVNEDSLWRIYSMTKPVTGVAAALLIEDGKLSLDQPVADFFPAYANLRVAIDPAKSLESRPATKALTVRHLLTHTGGLTYLISGRGPVQQEYARQGLYGFAIGDNRTTAATLGLPATTVFGPQPSSLADFAERLATVPLIAEPGSVWHYSVGLDLLGAVIERAAGMPFDVFLKRRVFDPLNMRSTAFQATDARRMTALYAALPNRGPVQVDPGPTSGFLQPPPFPMGGSGLVSSARDYFRFGAMLRGDGALGRTRIMAPETARLVRSDVMPAGVRFSDGGGFGFGGRVVTPDTKDANDGLGSYAWSGAAGTVFWTDPVKKSVIVMMIQIMPGEAYPIRKEFRAALAQG
jgi:CubicO group peptidase (beta-lactamase class C family)